MSEAILQQISRLMHSDGPQRDINGKWEHTYEWSPMQYKPILIWGILGDITITSEEDMTLVLEKLESESLCVDKVLEKLAYK